MMLRSRNTNLPDVQPAAGAAKPNADPPAKRAASKQTAEPAQGEPKAKRAALSELTTKLSSGLVIDSVRKGLGTRKVGENGETTTTAAPAPRQTRSTKRSDKLAPLAVVEGLEDDAAEDALPTELDPCPGYDYDAENARDPFNVPDYAFDIFVYHRKREAVYAVGDYMSKHPKLSRESRAILVDWMVEVQETFELNHETLYLAVKLVDTYLEKTKEQIKPQELQLIASAAVFLASKYEERQPPLVDDFLYLSEDSYKREELEEKEREMFRTVGFDLGAPLSYSHVRRFAKACKADMKVLTLARYVLETSLMFYEFVWASESKMAAGAFLLALKMMDETAEWTPVMHKYSGLTAAEVEPWVWMLNHMLHVRTHGRGVYSAQRTVADKYSHEVFFETAKVPLIEDRFRLTQPLVCPQ